MQGRGKNINDSLTAGGAWGEWYPYWTCMNLGVVGDTVDGLHSRIQQVEMLLPSKCFLMIGVNDLNYGTSVEMALEHYDALLADLAAMGQETDLRTYVLRCCRFGKGKWHTPPPMGRFVS